MNEVVSPSIKDDASPSPAQGTWAAGWRGLVVFLLVLAVLSSLMIVRARYGWDQFGDEAQALDIPMRYLAGDHPIVDSWESHFSFAMLLTPAVWVLEKIAPNRERIVLYFRFLWVLLQAIYVFFVWRLTRRLCGNWWAITIASIVFLYVPFYYLFAYYNNLAAGFFTISALLVLHGFVESPRPRSRFFVGAGIMSGLGAISYPPMVLALPLFAAGIALECRAQDRQRDELWRLIGRYAIGAGATLGAFVAITFLSSGFTHLAQALPRFLDPVDRDLSPGAIAFAFWKTRAVAIPPIVAATVFLAYALIRGRQRASAVVAIALTILTSIVATTILFRAHLTWAQYIDMPQSCAFGIGTAVLLLPLLAKRPPSTYRLLRLMCLPTIGLWVGTMFASHEGFETATMPTVILMIATLLALAEAMASEPQLNGFKWNAAMLPRLLALAAVALSVVFFWYTGTQYTDADGAVPQLKDRLTGGPYDGIWTTQANAEKYAYYMRIFGPMQYQPGRIAFVEEFMHGYLLTGRRPGTYSVSTTYARGDRWQRYLDITGNYPQTIVATRVWGYGSASDAQKENAVPIPPPFGLRDFSRKYAERYRDANFVVYERVR